MNKKRKNIIRYIIYVISLLFFIVFVILNRDFIKNYTIVPMQNGINWVGASIYQKENKIVETLELISENKKLKKQIDKLSIENNYLLQEQYDLIRLKKLYEIDKEYPNYDKIGAQVIGIDENFYSDFLYNTFTINKGSKDGIEIGMNVIAEGGLVGIVIETNTNNSKVRSIIDTFSNVSANVLSSPSKSSNCIVTGDTELMSKKNILSFHMLLNNKDIKVGDQIVTSDISSMFLDGLLIGHISDISLNNDNLTMSGKIIPSVNFKNINEVLVIKNLKQ